MVPSKLILCRIARPVDGDMVACVAPCHRGSPGKAWGSIRYRSVENREEHIFLFPRKK